MLQKLRARGRKSDAADRIEAQLAQSTRSSSVPGDAGEVLEELRASGRRWVFGSDEPREHEPPRAPPPEPEPEPEPDQPRQLALGRCSADSTPVNSAEPMDVLVLIDKLDDLVHNAKAVPLTDQVRIDREEIYDILDQMRATIPEEIKQARWIVKERQEMLAEAKRECDRILGEAREQAVREASQTEIVKLAERQARRHHRRRPAPGPRDAARDGGLGRLDPLDARGQPRQVPGRRQARPRAAARALAGVGRRRRRAPASRATNDDFPH